MSDIARLRAALEASGDLRIARDLALALRDELGDLGGARDVCLRGLAVPWSPDDLDDDRRLARYELTTLYLRLCRPDRQWAAAELAGAARLALPDRLLALAFSAALEGDFTEAHRLFAEGFAREPYHPSGHYDLACVLVAQGDLDGAKRAFGDAYHDGQARQGARAMADRDLAPIRNHVTTWTAGGHLGRSHSLSMFQVGPRYHGGEIRCVLRPECRPVADTLIGRMYCDPAVRRDPEIDFRVPESLESPTGFVIGMTADRRYFSGWELHRAIRQIAPLVEDVHGFLDDHNGGGYLDELRIRDGQARVRRVWLPGGSSVHRLDILLERAWASPDDRLLGRAVAAEIRFWVETVRQPGDSPADQAGYARLLAHADRLDPAATRS